ncbi:MAG TPA: signal peptidase II [Methylocella sp.]|jgi:signal peptidase II|nr:signal peptidase II [Methylocella sp.]
MAVSPRLLGLLATLAALIADQANKLWLIFVYGIEARQPIRLTPFFDVIYKKNTGISYSLLQAQTGVQRLSLLAFIIGATAFLGVWLWKARTKIAGLGLGLIVGGALGNLYDRLAYGFVTDFYHFHLGSFSWYVFNVADVFIVLGVGLLVYDSLFKEKKPCETERMAGE